MKLKLSRNKIYAGILTVGFLALVQPDNNPAPWAGALIGILFYEVFFRFFRMIRKDLREPEWWEGLNQGKELIRE
jgi:hypothetical protein